jgi:hypothetical protein
MLDLIKFASEDLEGLSSVIQAAKGARLNRMTAHLKKIDEILLVERGGRCQIEAVEVQTGLLPYRKYCFRRVYEMKSFRKVDCSCSLWLLISHDEFEGHCGVTFELRVDRVDGWVSANIQYRDVKEGSGQETVHPRINGHVDNRNGVLPFGSIPQFLYHKDDFALSVSGSYALVQRMSRLL